MCQHIPILVKMGKNTCISAQTPKTTGQILIRFKEYLIKELMLTNKMTRLRHHCRRGQGIKPFFCIFHVHTSLSREYF